MSSTADGGPVEALVRRDRAIVLAALALIVALAWLYLIRFAAGMTMPAGGLGGAMAVAPGFARWSAVDVLAMFAMWAMMMAGMMTPSAAPTILLYSRVARHSRSGGQPLAATGWFASGYLLAWTLFSAAATGAQWALEGVALLSPAMRSASPLFGGVLLIAAGLYQWTPAKHACLVHCQAPFHFIQRHGGFRGDPGGALGLGLRHGFYCIGCCWALMLLLFVGGVMNLLWIAALAALVLAEKLFRQGRVLARIAGLAFAVAGVGMIAGFV